eukprot:COSAG04_NODE_130_length_24323_cov_50.932835_22_plen_137_part_00
MSAALYEVVLARGRVLDPESGLDAIRDVGIAEGRVVALSEAELSADGAKVIDCTGLVVAPGFIDLHSHGMKPCDAELQVRGTTGWPSCQAHMTCHHPSHPTPACMLRPALRQRRLPPGVRRRDDPPGAGVRLLAGG